MKILQKMTHQVPKAYKSQEMLIKKYNAQEMLKEFFC